MYHIVSICQKKKYQSVAQVGIFPTYHS